ncbi:hypothetical protein FRC09_006028 [Ceratobasidium sp. 395]|nr:hypothetical protein FRC09_006028 [Ceratobasidium sp. 395]
MNHPSHRLQLILRSGWRDRMQIQHPNYTPDADANLGDITNTPKSKDKEKLSAIPVPSKVASNTKSTKVASGSKAKKQTSSGKKKADQKVGASNAGELLHPAPLAHPSLLAIRSFS